MHLRDQSFGDNMLSSQHVLNCSFSKWYPLFGHISINSQVIKLSEDFIKYLLSDGIVLPKSDNNGEDLNGWSDDNDNDEDNGSNDGSDDDSVNDIEFVDIEQQMKQTLGRFGSVFVKLNWSSCEDSQWMSLTGTQCLQTQDIYLLLKSSDKIVHDLTQPFKYCLDVIEDNSPHIEYELILKKWIDINPSMEFRCFIADNQIIGITQRDVRSYYEHIHQQKEDIIGDIQRFFGRHLKNKFFDEDFVIDVYRPDRGQVILIDINPFGKLTDSLLFDWQEIFDNKNNGQINETPEFRYLTSDLGVQPQRYTMNSIPVDLLNGYTINDVIDDCNIDR
ncbi:cell division cycle protein 123 homolog [Oppia nitens]|uniref:cell division cycle protein 123 homolog n=1 Tax=Oppia nitens TaxID=1686743 RepID=UPI0023D99A2F|nr:cell division cycle protein 123 homolog [Oppia nitens]